MPIRTFQREHWDPAVERFIRQRRNWTAKSIDNELRRLATKPVAEGGLGLTKTKLPTLRTIKRRLAMYRAVADEGIDEPWQLTDEETPDEAVAFLCGIQADLVVLNLDPLTKRQAHVVSRMHAVAPSLPAMTLLPTAFVYLDGEDDDRHDAEVFLALRPWETDLQRSRWDAMVKIGRIHDAVAWNSIADGARELVRLAPSEPTISTAVAQVLRSVADGLRPDPEVTAKNVANAPRKRATRADTSGRRPRSAKRGTSTG